MSSSAQAKKPAPTEAQRRAKRLWARRQKSEKAEVGPPPLTRAQKREGKRLREAIWDDLVLFDTEVFPNSSGLKPYGEIQLASIEQDYEIITKGGRVVRAEPRAYTKTTRTCNHALWAVLTDRRLMVPVFSANLEKSKNQIMARWKTEVLTNELLFWMFPELIWPLRALENKPQRCASQTYKGELTHVQWNADRIVFPHCPGVPGSGSILIALPLKSCRGATHTRPDGTILRPDLVIFDDVQKDEDADNPNTVRKLEELINHSAMMLGGHAKTMSAIMNCTVRRVEDLSEQYLKKPSWRRVRYKMLEERAKHEKEFWLGEYADIRKNFDPESKDDQMRAKLECLALYESKRAYADEGAQITWEWGYAWADEVITEVSAVQHAYNVLIDEGEDVFSCECQNEPSRDTGGLAILTPEAIRNKQSGYERGKFPPECTKLVAFVDVHEQILYYQVWAFQQLFTGFMIEDESFPSQHLRNFSHDMLAVPLDRLFPGLDDGARVTAGLDALIHGHEKFNPRGLLTREFVRSDGVPMKIDLCGIDANGSQASYVKSFIRQSPHSSRMHASFGRGITASSPPMSQWQQCRKGGYRDEWAPTTPVPGEPQGVIFDTNFWKAKFHRALALAPGSQGALYLYKAEPEHHRMFSEHANSELPKEVMCGQRIVYEFPRRPLGDNHKFDVAVGCMVAASKAGIRSVKTAPPKKRVSLEELRKRALQRRNQRGRPYPPK